MQALALLALLAAAAPSRVEKVVVFPDRAQVTRVARGVACGSLTTVRFEHLPPAADTGSFRARAQGATVVGLRAQTQTREELFAPRLETLDKQARALERELEGLGDERAQAEGFARVGGKYSEVATALVSREMALARPDVKGWASAFEQSLGWRLSAAARQVGVDARVREVKHKLEDLRREQGQLSAAAQRREHLAEVLVDCPAGRQVAVELTYLVGGASWTPAYEVRADEAGGTVELTTYATLQQATGEDWQQATLVLSTAVPVQEATPPELQTLEVGASERRPEKKVLVRRDEAVEHARAGEGGGFAGDQALRAQAQGLSVQLEVPEPAEVRGDGTPARLRVGRTRMKARLTYRTVPKMMPFVFRVAELVNTAPYPLLPGPVDVFRRDGFIGRHGLERVPQGGTFQLTFGVEEQLRVERKALEEVARSSGLFGSHRRFRYAYRFELSSFASGPLEVELAEHIPVSELEDVKVALEEQTTVGYTLVPADGIVTWKLRLGPAEKRTVELAFHLDVPGHYESGGL